MNRKKTIWLVILISAVICACFAFPAAAETPAAVEAPASMGRPVIEQLDVSPFMIKVMVYSSCVPEGVAVEMGYEVACSGEIVGSVSSTVGPMPFDNPCGVQDYFPIFPNIEWDVRPFLKDLSKGTLYYGEWQQVTSSDNGSAEQLRQDVPNVIEASVEDVGKYLFFSFDSEENAVYEFDCSAPGGAPFRFGRWNQDDCRWDSVSSEEGSCSFRMYVESGMVAYLYIQPRVDASYTVTMTEGGAGAYTAPVIDSVNAGPFSMDVCVSAGVPVLSNFLLGMEYGPDQDSCDKIDTDIWNSHYDTASFTLRSNVVPGSVYRMRPYVKDMTTEDCYYGEWTQVTTPRDNVSTALRPGTEEKLTVPDEGGTYDHYYSFTAPETGHYRFSSGSKDGRAYFMDYYLPVKGHWETAIVSGSWSYIVNLAAGDTVYFDMRPEYAGSYTLRADGYEPKVTSFSAPDGVTAAVYPFRVDVEFPAEVPLGSSFSIGLEYGPDKDGTAANSSEKVRLEKYADETVIYRDSIFVVPGTSLRFRAYVHDLESNEYFRTDWQSVSTPEEDDSVPIVLDEDKETEVTQIDVYSRLCFSFTAPKEGYYDLLFGADSNYPDCSFYVWDRESFSWTYDYRHEYCMRRLSAGEKAYMCLEPYSDGTYTVRAREHVSTVTDFSSLRAMCSAYPFGAYFSAVASTPLDSSFTVSIEYGLSKESARVAGSKQYTGYESEEVMYYTGLPAFPQTVYFWRAVLEPADGGDILYTDWKQFTTPAVDYTVAMEQDRECHLSVYNSNNFSFTAPEDGLYLFSVSSEDGSGFTMEYADSAEKEWKDHTVQEGTCELTSRLKAGQTAYLLLQESDCGYKAMVTKRPDVQFVAGEAFLDTGWGDDEYCLRLSFTNSGPVSGCGIAYLRDKDGNDVEVLLSPESDPGFAAGTHNVLFCVYSIDTDGSESGALIEGGTYYWKGYVTWAGEKMESEEYSFVFSRKGSRFLRTGLDVKTDGGGLEATVSPEFDGTYYCAVYDGAGRMLAVQAKALEAGKRHKFTFSGAGDGSAVKVFSADENGSPILGAAARTVKN